VTVGLVLFTTVISVTWPEWTRHWALGQVAVLRKKVLSLAIVGVVVCVPGAVIAVAALPTLIRLWLHDASITPPTLLVVTFVAYLAVRLWTDVHSSALMAGNRVASATRFAMVQALITAPLEFLFGRQWGAEGVIFGLLLGFLVTTAWLFPRRFYGEIRSLSLRSIAHEGTGVA
jgi:O-antigen/teichoic acid export membrane protein